MKTMNALFSTVLIAASLITCDVNANNPISQEPKMEISMNDLDIVTLGGGCFWCIEAVFLELEGVRKVVSGYMGGHVDNPSYKEVCNGTTGHAEVVQVIYDPTVVSLETILDVFWTVHDPTTLNRQGADVGTQYRSAIYYHNDKDKAIAQKSMTELATELWDDPIVTELTAASTFYPAEDYHQNYYNNNKSQGYCRVVINPKLSKFRKKFEDKLKAQ